MEGEDIRTCSTNGERLRAAVHDRMVQEGDMTPWGHADTVTPIGNAGIVFASTSSHGGFYVPAALNVEVDPLYRAWAKRWSGSEQWYEEDCCAAAVVVCLTRFFSNEELARAQELLCSMRKSGCGPWKEK
jgi:Domain of unknown function (DUF7007)